MREKRPPLEEVVKRKVMASAGKPWVRIRTLGQGPGVRGQTVDKDPGPLGKVL